ncbi:MAG: sensor histidine kinase [Pseudomonas fluorescens]
MTESASATARRESGAAGHYLRVPEVTLCAGRIANARHSQQHDGMRDHLRPWLQPLNLALLLTWGAVALSFRTELAELAALRWALMLVFLAIGLCFDLPKLRVWRETLLLIQTAAALLLIWSAPNGGTAPVLLVVLAAQLSLIWPLSRAVLAMLAMDVAFYLILRALNVAEPLLRVIIYAGFQTFALLVGYYASNAERARNQLALVNADLLATRALLADSARDAERLRVARELHDIAGHKLTAMKLSLRALAAEPALAQHGQIAIAQKMASELLDDIRNVVQALRDSRGLDLHTALRALAAPLPKPALRLHIDERVKIADPALAEALLRLAQEALTNSARHANADTLSVDLSCDGDGVLLRIEDDGQLQGRLREGNGIAGMRERVAGLGGTLRLDNTPQGGLRIEARLPA